MFTIFGASGNTGSVVAERLLAAGHEVRAVVRRPEAVGALAARGATVLVGDVADTAFVHAALAGATGAWLVAPPDHGAQDLLAKNAHILDNYAAALRAHAVPHAAFLSSVGAHLGQGVGPSRFSAYGESVLRDAPVTFVRAPAFMENLLGAAAAMRGGVLPVFGGGVTTRAPMIAARDVGHAGADVLIEGPGAGRVVELRGPRDLSPADVAVLAGALLGRVVQPQVVPVTAMEAAMVGQGMSPSVAALFREMTEALLAGRIQPEGTGRTAIGRTTLDEVLRAALLPEPAAVARDVFEQVMNQGRFDLLPTLFSPSYTTPQGDVGPAAFARTMAPLRTAFPDLTYTVEDTVTDGDRVAARWRWTGTHRGVFQGQAPTGRSVTVTGMSFYQLAHGQIVRTWTELDRLGFQAQVAAG